MSVFTNTQAQKQLKNRSTAEWRRRRQEHSKTVNYSKTVDQTEVSRNETVLKELIFFDENWIKTNTQVLLKTRGARGH